MLNAMIGVVATEGYETATVEEVIDRATVSPDVFHEYFRDKEDCLLEVLNDVIGRAQHVVQAEYGRPGPWAQRVRNGLAAFLDVLASDPEGTRVAMVDSLGASATTRERYRQALDGYARYFAEGRSQSRMAQKLPAQTEHAIVGGIAATVARRVLAGDVAQLHSLLPDLTYFALVPYVGHATARAVAQEPEPATTA
jgi:AcrR family transcriptional regulator